MSCLPKVNGYTVQCRGRGSHLTRVITLIFSSEMINFLPVEIGT